MLVEELILHFMSDIFEKYAIKSKALIRIIRNADIDIDEDFYDEDISYRESMEKLLKVRKKLCPVKMEYSRHLDEKVIKALCKELKLKKEQVLYSESPLELSFINKIRDILRNRKELFYPRKVPKVPTEIKEESSIINLIEQKDMLLSYPYDSMYPFLKLLKEAVTDSRVVSIKMTLYRLAKNSRIVETLIEAAENGKEVVVMVELKARFDEKNNLEWSRRMEDAEHLLVAPRSLQNKVLDMIDNEIRKVKNGEKGYIGLKMNSLTDKVIIDKLIEASKAGVKINMIIRGICCLIAGVSGETDNITVRSIVGRYLEHSRIYIFGEENHDKIFISSADFMTRNTLRRVEVAAPIYDESIKKKIRNLFDTLLHDNVNALEMTPHGNYIKVQCNGDIINSQD